MTVVAKMPIKNAPTKNGLDDWYGDRPALDTIMLSLDLVRLYEVSNVPINTANGKNIGMYSNNRSHESTSVDMASGFAESRSTNVTAKITPHTVNITSKKLAKKRRNKNNVKTLGFNLIINYSIIVSNHNCKIKFNVILLSKTLR